MARHALTQPVHAPTQPLHGIHAETQQGAQPVWGCSILHSLADSAEIWCESTAVAIVVVVATAAAAVVAAGVTVSVKGQP